jgi:hypothetical protein
MAATQHEHRVRKWFVLWGLGLFTSFVSPACGGQMAHDWADPLDAGSSSGGAPASVANVPASGAGAPTAVAGAPSVAAREACASPRAVSVTGSWQGFGYYGQDFKFGYFGFSADGAILESPGRFPTRYDVATGLVLGNGSVPVVSRDQAWARELSAGQVLEGESRRVLLEAGELRNAKLSGDGRYLFWLGGDCASDVFSVNRQSVDSHEHEALPLAGFCDNGVQPTLTVTTMGSAALVSNGSRLWHTDFEGRQSSSFEIDTSADIARRGMSIALSPDDRSVATIGSDNLLRTWTYPSFEPVLTGLPVAWSRAFAGCYCQPLPLAPLAWSADGRLLASPDATGHAVIRRSCDGEILTTLAPLGPMTLPLTERATDRGPLFLAFASNGGGLAVGFEAGLAYFGLDTL